MNLYNNYFAVFGLPVGFDVDLSDLGLRYRNLQKQLHPDKFSNSSNSERALSVQKTAMVNDAYNVLKNPLLRARYMLELKGVLLNDEVNTIMDPEFLMQQMELRESIDQVRFTPSPLTNLDKLAEQIRTQILAMSGELKTMFANGNNNLDAIATYIRKMQFFARLQQEVDSLYEKYER